jgi:hypothetical protein
VTLTVHQSTIECGVPGTEFPTSPSGPCVATVHAERFDVGAPALGPYDGHSQFGDGPVPLASLPL